MFVAKAWYLTFFGGLVVMTMLNPYFVTCGLSDRQIGIITGLRPLLSGPATFAWSALADHTGMHRYILVALVLIAASLRILLLAGRSFVHLLVVVLVTDFFCSPVFSLVDAAVTKAAAFQGLDYGKSRLWGAIGWGGAAVGTGRLMDTLGMKGLIAYHLLMTVPCAFFSWMLYDLPGAQSNNKSYDLLVWDDDEADAECAAPRCCAKDVEQPSQARLQLSCETCSSPHGPAHAGRSPLPPLCGLVDFVADAEVRAHLLMCTVEPLKEVAEADEVGQGAAVDDTDPFSHKLLELLRCPAILLFLWTTVVMGIGFGTIDSFLFLHLQRLGGSATLMGLTLTVACSAEIYVFHVQEWLLARFNVERVLDMVVLVYALRLLCYALLPWAGSAWFVLPVEILHGVTFAAGFGAGTVHMQRLAPPGLEATMQSLFQWAYFGLGFSIGALGGGQIAGATGSLSVLFFMTAGILVVCWLATVACRSFLLVAAPQADHPDDAPLEQHLRRDSTSLTRL